MSPVLKVVSWMSHITLLHFAWIMLEKPDSHEKDTEMFFFLVERNTQPNN